MRPSPRPSARVGTVSSLRSGRTSTRSGTAPTSRSTATPSCNRRCGSRSSRWCKRAARAERRAIPAKGLTGNGYDGHTFWDTETYTLPVLTYTAPQAAQGRAVVASCDVAARPTRASRRCACRARPFPWRTIHGEECSGYWPAGTAGFHINADIADAVRRYVSGDGGRRVRARAGYRDPRRNGPALGVARALRRSGSVQDRRRDRARRIHRARRQQHVHELDGRAKPLDRRGCRRSAPRTQCGTRCDERRCRGMARRRGRQWSCRSTRSSA